MLKLYFKDSPEKTYLVEFSQISNNIVQIVGDIPKNTSGFVLSRPDHVDHWDYSEFNTIYKMLANNVIQFSNDGSQWLPPKKNVIVKVVWEDNENESGIRPKTAKVTVLADGEIRQELSLRKSNGWCKEYTNVPDEDEYTITADEIEGYSKDINGTVCIYRLMEVQDEKRN